MNSEDERKQNYGDQLWKIVKVGLLMSSCKCSDCGGATGGMSYMYRNLKGVSTFTGFVSKAGVGIVWVGKDEKERRPIVSDEDRQFFMQQMKQYDP